ncbi:hypothetical protein V1478_013901 [Vespula squamosa]|uniref:Uncharacterized protein n=1 Tax=Vespula squamosa TaxID=30214 RepID=A0ABD2A921_VESSQ
MSCDGRGLWDVDTWGTYKPAHKKDITTAVVTVISQIPRLVVVIVDDVDEAGCSPAAVLGLLGKSTNAAASVEVDRTRDGLRFCFLSTLESTTAPWTEFKGKRVSLGCSSAPHHRKAQPLMLLGPAFIYNRESIISLDSRVFINRLRFAGTVIALIELLRHHETRQKSFIVTLRRLRVAPFLKILTTSDKNKKRL